MGVESKEKATFDIIYNENAEIVYKVAVKYSGNHHIAEEITQTVFMKLFMNIRNVNLEAVRSWLILTAKYMSLNYKRDMQHEVLVDDVILSEEGNSVAVQESGAEDVFMKKMKDCEMKNFTGDIFEALYRKNPRWFEAVTITYILEKPQKEVAEIMGVSLDVLHSMLYRAKRWIRKNYEGQYDHLHE